MINTKHLNSLRKSLVRNGQSERGTTLIELMVVISIISILSIGILYLITALFNSQAQGSQAGQQQSTAQDIRNSLSATSHDLEASHLGSTNDAGKVTSVSLARDNFFAELPEQGICVRYYYVERLKQLREATAPLGSCDDIRPVRGPNELLTPHGTATGDCFAPCWHTDPGYPLYDPVLDNDDSVHSFVVASNVVPNPNGIDAEVTADYAPFSYRDKSGDSLNSTISLKGNSGTVYDGTPAINSQVNVIGVQLYIAGSHTTTSIKVSPLSFSQRLTLVSEATDEDGALAAASSSTPFVASNILSSGQITVQSDGFIGGSVATNASVTMQPRSEICGSIQLGSAGNLNNDQGVVGCGGEVAHGTLTMAAVTAPSSSSTSRFWTQDSYTGSNNPWSASQRSLTINSGTTVTLSGTNYLLCRLTLNGGSLVVASGANVRLYFDNPGNCQGSPSQQLVVNASSSINANAGTGNSLALLFIGSASQSTSAVINSQGLVNSTCTKPFAVYAPLTDLTVNSQGKFCGAIAAKSLMVSSQGRVDGAPGAGAWSLP
jgi:prepilin-type N-terminal cleavage/methylation domain-containing protein